MTELGSPTATIADTGVRIPKQGQEAAGGSGRRRMRHHIVGLFSEDQAKLAVRRYGYRFVLAVLAGAAICLARVPSGPGVLNTIWAEDGADYLTDALNRNPFKAIVRPLNGYFVIVPRLLTVPATLVPIEWAPTVMTIEAALVTGLIAVAVYIASRAYLRHPLARLVAALPVVAVPVGENIAAGTANNLATMQFAGVYLGLWMVLWLPKGRVAQAVSAVAVLCVSVTTILSALLLPLVLLRLYARRDRTSVAMVGGLVLGSVANVTAIALHLAPRPFMLPSNWDPVWGLTTAADWGLPHALFGYGITGDGGQAVDPSWLMWIALAIVVLVVAIAVARFTNPQWKVAAVLFVSAVTMLCATVMQYGGTELRYVVAPELMIFAALVALVLPRHDKPRLVAWVPLVAVSVGVVLVLGFSYRTAGPRTVMAPWRDSVATAREICRDPNNARAYIYSTDHGRVAPVTVGSPLRRKGPSGFPILIPCDRLR